MSGWTKSSTGGGHLGDEPSINQTKVACAKDSFFFAPLRDAKNSLINGVSRARGHTEEMFAEVPSP